MMIFGVCFVLYLIKLSAGKGYKKKSCIVVIFQTSREGSPLFSDVVPVPRAVEFKMATRCKFLSLAAS